MVLCCRSTGAASGDDPCGGDEAATILLNQTHQVLRVASRYHTASYRIDLLVRR